MAVRSENPQIARLRLEVEEKFGKSPKVHNDFEELARDIRNVLKEYISETTLERVWQYSSRGYSSVSLHTLDLLSKYSGYGSWENFCRLLREKGEKDSDMFNDNAIYSEDLKVGEQLQIGWLPDRICVIKYLGEGRFEALKCENSTMKEGDIFVCQLFMLHQPAVMDHFIAKGSKDAEPKRYVAGIVHGLTLLKKL